LQLDGTVIMVRQQPRFFNSFTQAVAPLQPLKPGHVSLYVCGPTVYDDAHLGHARCYLTWDFLVRSLRALGYSVTYARNVTDVDDKILNRAEREQTTYTDIADRYYARFTEDMNTLNILPPDSEPRATQHIPTMLEATQALVNKGYAYACTDGTVYFRKSRYADYGQLSRRVDEDMQAGARVDLDPNKEHPMDFALWKGTTHGESWTSPWGQGRPGWHIECSCMIRDVLGEQIDIHAGGADLLFPHHENERAQSEAWLDKKPFVQVWMHNGFVNVSGEKMSKSLGNFATIRSLLSAFSADAIRYFVASHHYRMPVDFHQDALTGAQNWVNRAYRTWQDAAAVAAVPNPKDPPNHPLVDKFLDCLADDLNTPKALAILNEGLSDMRKAGTDVDALHAILPTAAWLWVTLGFSMAWADCKPVNLPVDSLRQLAHRWGVTESADPNHLLDGLITCRTQAKQQKDWATADGIRQALAAEGITLQDRKDGHSDWSYTPRAVTVP
jgi:cysteinyl-tRNA synthetase